MNFFDLHCDTAGECAKQGLSLADNELQINLRKGECLDKWAQCFAIWVPDEYRGEEAEHYFDRAAAHFKNQIAENSGKIKLCKEKSDFDEAIRQGACTAFLTLEGGSAACGNGRLEKLKQDGVKLITLTWNAENEIAGGCQGAADQGFTPRGKALVKEMERLNIIADVSHINRTSFFELMAMETSVPVVASHSDCAAVLEKTMEESIDKTFSLRRSLTDEQIRLLIERGGLIGLNFCDSFLGDPGDDGFEAVYRHMAHILELGGEHVLAVGSDFDGCNMNSELDSLEKMPSLRTFLEDKGLDKDLLDRIFYENAREIFLNVLQKG